MVFQAEDRARTKKQRTEVAIQLALDGRWDNVDNFEGSNVSSGDTVIVAIHNPGEPSLVRGRGGCVVAVIDGGAAGQRGDHGHRPAVLHHRVRQPGTDPGRAGVYCE